MTKRFNGGFVILSLSQNPNLPRYIMGNYYVYILASAYNGTLYVGVTNDLVKRVWQHKNGFAEGFTKKYKVYMLVYYEVASDAVSAIKREKQLKVWKRQWKLNAINVFNPEWKDLYPGII